MILADPSLGLSPDVRGCGETARSALAPEPGSPRVGQESERLLSGNSRPPYTPRLRRCATRGRVRGYSMKAHTPPLSRMNILWRWASCCSVWSKRAQWAACAGRSAPARRLRPSLGVTAATVCVDGLAAKTPDSKSGRPRFKSWSARDHPLAHCGVAEGDSRVCSPTGRGRVTQTPHSESSNLSAPTRPPCGFQPSLWSRRGVRGQGCCQALSPGRAGRVDPQRRVSTTSHPLPKQEHIARSREEQ